MVTSTKPSGAKVPEATAASNLYKSRTSAAVVEHAIQKKTQTPFNADDVANIIWVLVNREVGNFESLVRRCGCEGTSRNKYSQFDDYPTENKPGGFSLELLHVPP